MARSRPSTRTYVLVAAACVPLAACGGSSSDDQESSAGSAPVTAEEPGNGTATTPPASDAQVTDPPATDPSTTDAPGPTDAPPASDAPPTTDFELGADSVALEFGDGFVRLDIWPDWEIDTSEDSLFPYFAALDEPAWAFDVEGLDSLVFLKSPDDSELSVSRERRFLAVDYETWRDAMRARFASTESSPLIDEGPAMWADVEGEFISVGSGEPVRSLYTANIDGNYVAARTTAWSPESQEQIDAMLANIRFDTDVIGPLTHSLDMEFVSTAAGPEIAASVLVPYRWEQAVDSESLEYRDPLTGATASITLTPSQGGVDALEAVIAETGLLEAEAVREDSETNDLGYAVLWDGPPRDANTAIIVADDGNYGVIIRVQTADDLLGDEPFGERLIDEMVASVWFRVHGLQ